MRSGCPVGARTPDVPGGMVCEFTTSAVHRVSRCGGCGAGCRRSSWPAWAGPSSPRRRLPRGPRPPRPKRGRAGEDLLPEVRQGVLGRGPELVRQGQRAEPDRHPEAGRHGHPLDREQDPRRRSIDLLNEALANEKFILIRGEQSFTLHPADLKVAAGADPPGLGRSTAEARQDRDRPGVRARSRRSRPRRSPRRSSRPSCCRTSGTSARWARATSSSRTRSATSATSSTT